MKHLLGSLYLSIFLCLYLASCSPIPEDIKDIIEDSGKNRKELDLVVNHYINTGENEKLKAVYFLIRNSKSMYHYEGNDLLNYRKNLEKLANVPEGRKEYFEMIWDSLQKAGPATSGMVERKKDLLNLSSKLLINHIDASFRAWKLPWAQNLTFEEFCEYILPYKLVDENPTLWNGKIQDRYKDMLDTINKTSDAYTVCLIVNNDIKQKFKIRSIPLSGSIGFEDLDLIKSGKCFHATQYTTYIMRSLGIPVVMDFTPYWGNLNGGHEWNALIINKKPIPFVGSESDPGKTKIDLAFQRKRGKVYRHTFSQNEVWVNLIRSDEEIPELFKNTRLLDVTQEYIPTSTLNLIPYESAIEYNNLYLFVFNRQQWMPLALGEVTDGKATFKNVGRDILYLPGRLQEGEVVAAAPPVLITETGALKYLECNRQKRKSLKILKKGPSGPSIQVGKHYELLYWDRKWVSAGRKEATGQNLTFNNIPSNTVYWIRSEDKKSNERIFTEEKGEQKWW